MTPTPTRTPVPLDQPNTPTLWDLARDNALHIDGLAGVLFVVALVVMILAIIAFVAAVTASFEQRRGRLRWGWFFTTLFVLALVLALLITHDPTLFGLTTRLGIDPLQ